MMTLLKEEVARRRFTWIFSIVSVELSAIVEGLSRVVFSPLRKVQFASNRSLKTLTRFSSCCALELDLGRVAALPALEILVTAFPDIAVAARSF